MHEKSIELLNKAVADELSAVHQYMYFHFHCEDQGYDLLGGLFLKTAIEEMGHIERCAERILFKHCPNFLSRFKHSEILIKIYS